jgi:mercuric reductase
MSLWKEDAMATIIQEAEPQKLAAQGKDVLQILNHLQHALPLRKRRQALAPHLRIVHREILKSLAETGKPPTQAQIAAMLGSKQSALNAMAVLASNDLVILNSPVSKHPTLHQLIVSDQAEVLGAYPMTTENTPHKVIVCGHSVNAMCAVDALTISPMFGHPTSIESRCHVTGTPIRILQHGMQILEANPSPEIRVGIRWQQTGACAAHSLCTEMVFLKDEPTAGEWSRTQGSSDLLTLPEAIELGTAFFLPLIEE